MSEIVTHQILCSVCKVPLEPIPGSQPPSWRCPRCGVGDTRENVVREAKEHAEEVAARFIQDKVKEAGQKCSFFAVEVKPIPKREYRFITGFEL